MLWSVLPILPVCFGQSNPACNFVLNLVCLAGRASSNDVIMSKSDDTLVEIKWAGLERKRTGPAYIGLYSPC